MHNSAERRMLHIVYALKRADFEVNPHSPGRPRVHNLVHQVRDATKAVAAREGEKVKLDAKRVLAELRGIAEKEEVTNIGKSSAAQPILRQRRVDSEVVDRASKILFDRGSKPKRESLRRVLSRLKDNINKSE